MLNMSVDEAIKYFHKNKEACTHGYTETFGTFGRCIYCGKVWETIKIKVN